MRTYSRLGGQDLTRRLVDAGFLAGDAQDSAIIDPAPPGLFISQTGSIFENSASDCDSGYGTLYSLSLHLAVDVPAMAIWGWRLDLPWEDPQFQWLAEPQGHEFPENMYQFPGCPDLMFPRDEVINHRRRLQRGRGLDGLLLGFGFESIPDSYRHGATIDASLVLIDDMGRDFPTPVQLWANRIARIDRRQAKKKTRRQLFENRDPAKVGAIKERYLKD